MLHPHSWVRFTTAQVFGLVFSTYNPDDVVATVLSEQAGSNTAAHTSFLLNGTKQKLRDFSADLCTQLSSRYMEEEFAAQVYTGLPIYRCIYSIIYLSSL